MRINISFCAWPELKERSINEVEVGGEKWNGKYVEEITTTTATTKDKAHKHYIEYFVATDVISWSDVMLVITHTKKLRISP